MIAIYARKSVFREDSISIESQIEMCQYETKGEPYVIYADNGYSGKDTSRPEFQRMINDIECGKINRVVVYKLDRISRSILDFSKMIELFQEKNVDFVSTTEHFDTSSPMGRAMLNICIVFAQLERETIQQRVADAYLSRSKKGFYMGGKIPYGYIKVPIEMNGIKTSMYEIKEDEAQDIRLIYQIYSQPSATLGDVLRGLIKLGININKRGHAWSTARLSEIMRNPVYTFADTNTYDFFKSQGSNIINPISDFCGKTSLYLFKGENTNRKTWDLQGQNIVVAPHTPIIDSTTWLKCRKKLLSNHQVKTSKAKNSIFCGKLKCAYCGYSLIVRKSARKNGTVNYFVDSGKCEMKLCTHKLPTMRTTETEDLLIQRIRAKINTLTIKGKSTNDIPDKEKLDLLAQKEQKEKSINALIDSIEKTEPSTVTMMYINKKIESLDKEVKQLNQQIEVLEQKFQSSQKNVAQIHDAMSKWSDLSFDEKREVVNLLIDKIIVHEDNLHIIWNI